MTIRLSKKQWSKAPSNLPKSVQIAQRKSKKVKVVKPTKGAKK